MSDAKDQAFQPGNRLAEAKTNAFPQRMTFVVRSFQDEKFVNVPRTAANAVAHTENRSTTGSPLHVWLGSN